MLPNTDSHPRLCWDNLHVCSILDSCNSLKFVFEYSVETEHRVRTSLLSSPPRSLICFCDIDNSTKFLKKQQVQPKSNQGPQPLVSTQARTGGTPAEGGGLQSWCCCWRQEHELLWSLRRSLDDYWLWWKCRDGPIGDTSRITDMWRT